MINLPRLTHYSQAPVSAVRSVPQTGKPHFKPRGLWVSCDDHEMSWPEWCRAEDFGLGALVHDVTIRAAARILRLSTAKDIDALTKAYSAPLYPGAADCGDALAWDRIATQYQGIVIAPYIWDRRLDGGAGWYYAWDCASGCIWDADAIEAIALREMATADLTPPPPPSRRPTG